MPSGSDVPKAILYAIRRLHRILVLPDPDNLPPALTEETVGLPVACLVSRQLVLPPFGVGLRPRAVLGAGMPEAAVYVNRHVSRAEHDVGTGTQARNGGTVHPEAEATAVQLRADRQLRESVAAAETGHLGALSRR
jgi:hypothetical protein